MRRVLSIWLLQLPLDRRVRMGDLRPDDVFAIIAEIKNAWRLTHLSELAQRAGLSAGLSVPDARAICPALLTEPADPSREQALLRVLQRWADKLSPTVAIDPPDGLLMDISGCAHLFGGEEKMAQDAIARLQDMQIMSRIGIADTKGAAWSLARFSDRRIMIAGTGKTPSALASLPLAALNIPDQLATDLRRTGLKSIGQLYEIKPAELARRFGLELIRRLDSVLGHIPDPVSPTAAEVIYAARMTLPDPIGLRSDLEGVLERLAASVCGRLAQAMKGARRFRLIVRCVDVGDHELVVGFARACQTAHAVIQQFAHPLDTLKVEFGADWFRLVAENIEPMQPRQNVMGQAEQSEEDLARIVSTLGNRLGFDRVRRFAPTDSHIPEREFAVIEAANVKVDPVWTAAPRKRPLRLYKRPERLRPLQPGRPPQAFEWRKTTYKVKSAKGPERLTPEWWLGGDARARDYWCVQTINGPRFWLMTYPGRGEPDWFVAGRFP